MMITSGFNFIKMKKKYTHLLWDFNGTIYDDADASRQATNVLLCERGLRQIASVRELQELFRFPVKDYYSALGFDYTHESYEDIAIKWSILYEEFSEKSELCEGVLEAITKFKKQGYAQTIISACEHKMLHAKLAALGVDAVFSDISGTKDSNAHSKIQIAVDWRARNPDAVAIMIGDTPHDFEVASAIGADCVLYSGGFVDRGRLAQCGCPVIESFGELLFYVD